MREAEWARNNSAATVDEYLANGYLSIALGPIVLPALYFVGPELSEEVVKSTEYHNLYKLMSTCGRLLYDAQSFKVIICILYFLYGIPIAKCLKDCRVRHVEDLQNLIGLVE